MAHVSGPTINLPGRCAHMPLGTMCDDHPDRPSEHRVCIEADSFGAEYADMCGECWTKYGEALREESVGECEWCHSEATNLSATRDPDEGMHGPVYRVCQTCREKQHRALEAELRWMEARYPELFDEGY